MSFFSANLIRCDGKTQILISMSKRSATEVETSTRDGEPFQKASGSGQRRENVTPDEMGEFEDAWEDEIESDEDVVDGAEANDEDGAPGKMEWMRT